MKAISKFLAIGAVLAASSSFAFADSIGVSGGDTFTSTGITFNPSTGVVSTAQDGGNLPGGEFQPFLFAPAQLTSFTFANAPGTVVFTSTIPGETISFTIDSLSTETFGTNSNGNTLDVSGLGTFVATGSINQTSAGTFSLTSSAAQPTNIDFGFQLIAAPSMTTPSSVTPEPNSLVLLGTGLLGAAGLLFSRRRNAVDLF